MDPYDGNLLLSTSPELLLFPAITLLSATIALLHSETAKWATFGSLIVLLIFIVIFFRSPPVRRDYDDLATLDMVSPADGRVVAIDEVSMSGVRNDYGKIVHPQAEENDSLRICIFLNLNDKHFQCAPTDSVVQQITYKRGEFHPAGILDKSQYNERMIVELASKAYEPNHYFVVLIAGLLARRILVFPEYDHHGAELSRGQKMSVIKFGSRVDLIISKKYEIQVQVGDRVRVGETLLAKWRP